MNEIDGDKSRQPDPRFSRREFLARAGATCLAVAGATAAGIALWQPRHRVPGFEPVKGITLPSYAVELPPGAPTLAVAHGADRLVTIKAAIESLGGMGRFVRRGDIVLLKPNVAFDRAPVLGATTHPDALRAVARLVREAGARRIIVADNPINSPAGCFLKSGLAQVATELDLKIVYPESSAFDTLQIDGAILKSWPLFHAPLRGVDRVIGIAPCKDHNLAQGSMTMKNWYGLLGGRRNQFHQNIDEVIADFALMIRPTLVVLDGTATLISNGPTGGRASDLKAMNTVVAGTDTVAVDAYGFEKLLDRDPARLGYIQMATRRGLGDKDWRQATMKETQV